MGCGCDGMLPAGGAHEQRGHQYEIVEWSGLRWHGTPYPLRLWAWLTHPAHPKPGSFAGCGCLVELKRAVGELREAWRFLNSNR